jgi:uncharacterized membrane protein YbjE (DUF340 family)
MWTVLAIMIVGIAVGFAIRKKQSLAKLNDKLTLWAIYLLLFMLGISIGANDTIINNLSKLGFSALLIALGGVAGSVAMAWAGYQLWFKKKG